MLYLTEILARSGRTRADEATAPAPGTVTLSHLRGRRRKTGLFVVRFITPTWFTIVAKY